MDAPADGIAIVGMAGRFPGAADVDAFWDNLRAGVESISVLSGAELAAVGVDPTLLAHPQFVGAGGVLAGADRFDARFFGFTAREAERMDPQHRLFLECAVEALERAGHDPARFAGLIGVCAGVGTNYYAPERPADPFEHAILSDKDHLATRVAYKLDLRGPAISVQTACSSSLVAVHLACQSLLTFSCDMVLAGGVRVRPQQAGYVYQEGMTLSPDGHCRAFDARARGTVRGSAVAIVVLRRLADALRDGDAIHAVIRSSAVNNDGAGKVGYTAPSVTGQAEVIGLAHAIAGVGAETIGYVEAHGTGTPLGDPIEIAALARAFRLGSAARGTCAIGSVKTNIGHTEAAAGVAGLIKAALCVEHGVVPASLHFETPNPEIDFAASPFFVSTRLQPFPSRPGPRRAGVSSFGIGGTNAHVVLEEAPDREPAGPTRPRQVIVLSARTEAALETATGNLSAHLARRPDLDLADLAYTLHVGRKAFTHRRALVCEGRDDLRAVLEGRHPGRLLSSIQTSRDRRVTFMFPGQGAQHPGMARDIFEGEPAFRRHLQACADALKPHLDFDLLGALSLPSGGGAGGGPGLDGTLVAQPALFAVEYATARLLMDWGVRPEAMIGHSLGEYVAACLAGVLSLEDALALVAARGRAMEATSPGGMLGVALAPRDVAPLLGDRLSLAAHNGPALCVVAGPVADLADLERRLSERGVAAWRLHVTRAFHSSLMDAALEPFARCVERITLRPPAIPFVSNVTGTWITDAQATDLRYWVDHLRGTVRFAEGVSTLLAQPGRVLLEVGPGHGLAALAASQAPPEADVTVLSALPRAQERQSGHALFLEAVARLWLAGVALDAPALYAGQRRRRVPLPTYPFERRRYWIDAAAPATGPARTAPAEKSPDIARWFHVPTWTEAAPAGMPGGLPPASRDVCVVFADECGVGERVAQALEGRGARVVTVRVADAFRRVRRDSFALDPREPEHYRDLVRALAAEGIAPSWIVHCWTVTREDGPLTVAAFEAAQGLGFYSLLHLARTLVECRSARPLRIDVVSNRLHDIGGEGLAAAKAPLLGVCTVISQEHDHIDCRSIDVALADTDDGLARLAGQLMDELLTGGERVVAYRGRRRWRQTFEPVHMPPAISAARLKPGGVYLITGGLGRIGLALAGYLARTARARLVLIARSPLPPRAEWTTRVATHDERDGAARRIRALHALEGLGAEVLPLAADVADPDAMRAALATAAARFGPLDGVVHAAGIVGDGARTLLQDTGVDQCRPHFRAKVHGLLVLDALLRDARLDFAVLVSSLSSVLGGLGFAAYASANSFLDAFAQARAGRSGPAWTSVNYGAWALGGRSTAAAMTAEEGVDVFARVLSWNSAPQVVVSPAPLPGRVRVPLTMGTPDGPPAGTSNATTRALSHVHDARPELATPYAAPVSPLEIALASIWQDVLGLDRVGIHDSFLDLGGDSLLAMRVGAEARRRLGLVVPLHALLLSLTVAELAAAISAPSA